VSIVVAVKDGEFAFGQTPWPEPIQRLWLKLADRLESEQVAKSRRLHGGEFQK
jgi:hypothetical protein